jgi:hypothetical protein
MAVSIDAGGVITALWNVFKDIQAMKTSEKLVAVDVRSSDTFPGNKNIDLTTNLGNRAVLCMVGQDNQAWLEDIFGKLKIGMKLDMPAYRMQLAGFKMRDQLRYIEWQAENGHHLYWGWISQQVSLQ